MSFKLNNGLEMPSCGLGTLYITDQDEMKKTFESALASGYRLFDTAMLYGNESALGNAIDSSVKEGSITRGEIFVTTKLWCTGHGAVEESLLASLGRLKLEYVDLYLIHWPVAYRPGPETFPKNSDGSRAYDETADICATWKAMEKLVEKGLTRSIGVSNFNSEQLQKLLDIADVLPVVNQVEGHVYFNQENLRLFCKERGIVLTAFSSLGAPGSKRKYPPLLKDETVLEIASKHGISASQVLSGFLVQRGIAVIPKSTNPERLAQNIDLWSFVLDESDMERLQKLDKGSRLMLLDLDADHPEFPFNIPF